MKKLVKILTKKFLIKEYIINKKSIKIIANETGYSKTTVWRYLKKYNILIRTIKSAIKLVDLSGKNNPNYKHGETLKQHYCIDCGNKIGYNSWKYGQGGCHSCAKKGNKNNKYIDDRCSKNYYCMDCGKNIKYGSKRCFSCGRISSGRKLLGRKRPEQSKRMSGVNHPNYIENLIREYPLKFDNKLKESIRIRDNHQCQICGKLEADCDRALDIHHIDYDKSNLNPENLISLCQNCHISTNYNREIYIEYFGILKESLIC